MVLFPHNSMFAYSAADSAHIAKTYALKLNSEKITTTDFSYWKKDFIESSLNSFARYTTHDNKVYLQEYFSSNSWVPAHLQKMTLPREDAAIKWLPWLATYAGYKPGKDSKIELYQYKFVFKNGQAVLTDSLLLFSQKTMNR